MNKSKDVNWNPYVIIINSQRIQSMFDVGIQTFASYMNIMIHEDQLVLLVDRKFLLSQLFDR